MFGKEFIVCKIQFEMQQYLFFSGENVVSQNICARACPYSEQKNNVGNEFLMQNILRKVVLLHTVFCREDKQNYKMARAATPAIFDLCMI